MNAAEMIAVLQTLPPDTEVLVDDWNEGYREPFPARLMTEERHPGKVIVTSETLEQPHEPS